jgi:hypothetical protein
MLGTLGWPKSHFVFLSEVSQVLYAIAYIGKSKTIKTNGYIYIYIYISKEKQTQRYTEQINGYPLGERMGV